MKYVKLKIKTSDQGQWRRSGVFIVNFKLISHLVLEFLFWTLSMYLLALCDLFYISIVFIIDGLNFHPFVEKISKKQNISTKWNAHGADLKQRNRKFISIKFIWWNLNYEVTSLIIIHFFHKQRLFSTQPQRCLSFSWVEVQMLLRCCLMHISIIILRHFFIFMLLDLSKPWSPSPITRPSVSY